MAKATLKTAQKTIEGKRVDDVVRGLDQLAEASAFGFNQVVLVTTLRKAKKIDKAVSHTMVKFCLA